MQEKRIINVQVKPLNVSSGMKIIGEGAFQQKYSRDDNAFYPSYSSILPLMVTVAVNLQDPDGVIPSGPATLDRIDFYLREYKPGNKIADSDPNYEIAIVNGIPVLKVKRNTPVGEPFLLIGEAFYTNPKTGRQESRIEQRLLSTIYYEASLLSLMAESPTEVIVDPTKIDDSNSSNWYVQLKSILKSGEIDLTENNAAYWWYVKEGKYTRLITSSDAWMVTTPNSDGTYPRVITVDASRFKNLKLECRAAYKGASQSAPASPTNASLLVQYNVRVDLPVFQNARQIPIAGVNITVKDLGTDKLIKSRCEITAGGRIIDNPEKYYNITWKATKADGTSSIIGYGEYIETTVKALGITYTNPVVIEPTVMPKIGSWNNVEGSVYTGIGATPKFQFGVNQIADKLGAYLVKCEDGVNVEIIGKLKNNNWMRFEDGSPAPTIVKSAAEDKGYNIMYGWTQTIHTIENAIVGSEVVALFGEEPFEYNSVQSRQIPPTLICPGLPAVVNGKFRSMYFKYRAGEGGSDGYLGITAFNKPDRTYPRTSLSQFTTNDFSVAHNADITKTIPFAPLMDWHLLNITNALMNKFGTVYLHDPNKFGAGISSNAPFSAENAGSTGVVYTMNDGDPAIYQKLSEQPSFGVNSSGTKSSWNSIISKDFPRMECLETQMALSYAAENNIQAVEWFNFNGCSYIYYNIPNEKTLLEGEMNARLIKRVDFSNLPAFDLSGNPITVHNAYVRLQTSTAYGMDLVSADVFQYAGAGIEKVATIQDDGKHLTKVFACFDQTKLTLDKTIEKTSGDFDFESTYNQVGSYTMSNSGYFTNLMRGTRIGTTKAGGLSDNTAYIDSGNGIGVSPVGKKVRVGHRVRGYGSWGYCSARSLNAHNPVSNARRTTLAASKFVYPKGRKVQRRKTPVTPAQP